MIVFLSVVYNMKFRKRWFYSARADGERFFVRAKNRRAGILCVFQADVLPPWRKKSGVDRRRTEPSFPNKKILSSLHWDESIADTSWCHPNLKGLPFLFAACSVRRAGDFGEALLIRPLGGCPSRALPQKSFSL
jgi:hypothetical protein